MTTNLNFASSNNFELIFSSLPFEKGIDEGSFFHLNIYKNVVPGASLGTDEQHWMGTIQNVIVGGLDFSDWTFEFLVDEEWKNWKSILKWIFHINNNKDKLMMNKLVYTTDATQIIKNNYGKTLFKIAYKNVVPYAIGDVELSYQNGEEYLTTNCSLLYDYYELIEE